MYVLLHAAMQEISLSVCVVMVGLTCVLVAGVQPHPQSYQSDLVNHTQLSIL